MIITREVLRRADAVKSKAFNYIQAQEPELMSAIMNDVDARLPKLLDRIRNMNPEAAHQPAIDFLKDVIGLAFMAETIARDIMESKDNKEIAAMVKKSYESLSDAVEKVSPMDEQVTADSVDAALKEMENEEK